MSKLRVGVIGLGYWGPNLVRNFYKTLEVEVTSLADLSKQQLDKIAKDYPSISTLTTNYKKLLKSIKVDAVAIATPVFTHLQIAKNALEAGKHVLIEKPMTSSVVEAENLINLAAKKNLILMVDHTFVYTSPVIKIKEFINKGYVWTLHYIYIQLGLILVYSNQTLTWFGILLPTIFRYTGPHLKI